MKIHNILIIALLSISILPILIVGTLSYKVNKKTLYNASKQNLEERAKFTKNLCEFYYTKINNNEISKEKAINDIGTILLGPKNNGKRVTKKGLRNGKSGYIDIARVSDLFCVIDPETEGKFTSEIDNQTLNIENILINTLKNNGNKGFTEYLWKNPNDKEYYTKVTALEYFKPFDWRISSTATLEEFIAPAKVVRNITILITLFTIIIVAIFAILISKKLSSPLNKLTKDIVEISAGNFTLKIPEFKSYNEIRLLGKAFNKMVSSINNYISDIEKKESDLSTAILHFGIILSSSASGDLTKKVDLSLIPDKYKPIGDNINKMVDALSIYINEIKTRENDLEKSINEFGHVLSKVSSGDLASRVALEQIGESYKSIGDNINKMIDSIKNYIEDLNNLNIKLERISKEKSAFLANMSHEVRTPLNAIMGFSEILKDGLVGELTVEQKEYLIDIYKSGKHLLSLINEILDLSKIEAGKMNLELEECDLKELLTDSLFVVKEKAVKHNIELNTNIDSNLGLVLIDIRKTKQIIFNLLSNAVKFTPDGGNVTIASKLVRLNNVLQYKEKPGFIEFPRILTKYKEFIEICVEDTGIGISNENMEKLFKEFIQIYNPFSKTRQTEGTGLGLTLVKKLSELHEGTVVVESILGKGSKFYVWIPYKKQTLT
mgnify:CR=1 FL=1|jgi:signal transduction histidine kinase/HAMP domain-containing protein